jgi:predicted PurR-regulated permease PerM
MTVSHARPAHVATGNVAFRAVWLGAALVVGALLVRQLLSLILAVILTVILSLPLSAAASRAQRRGLPRSLGALAALTVGLGGIAALGFLVLPQFVTQAKQFAAQAPAILTAAERYVHGLTGVATRNLDRDVSHFLQGYTQHPLRLIGPLAQVGLTAVAAIVVLVVVIVAAFLIATNPDALLRGFLRLFPIHRRDQVVDVLARIKVSWLGWLAAVGLDMLVLGGLLFLGMVVVGLPFALGFAVFSAFMTVIPNYGSVISAVPPVLVGLSYSPGKGLLVLAVYVIVNQFEGNVLLPLMMARTVDLHPAVVAIGVLVMATLFGLIGVVIAIPLLSSTIILVQALWIEPQEARFRQ